MIFVVFWDYPAGWKIRLLVEETTAKPIQEMLQQLTASLITRQANVYKLIQQHRKNQNTKQRQRRQAQQNFNFKPTVPTQIRRKPK